MLNTDISYYFIDQEFKSLNLYQILQLSPNFDPNQPEVKTHVRNLLRAFHPDKSVDHKALRQEAFKYIMQAYKVLFDAESREKYDESLNPSTGGFVFVPVVPMTAQEFQRIYEEIITIFKDLNDDDEFNTIYTQLMLKQRSTLITMEQSQEQRRLFQILKTKAKTPEDFFRLVTLQRANDMDYGHPAGELLHITANLGHLEAMRMRASYILFGYYPERQEQLNWALDCIDYLEKDIIPQLQAKISQELAFHQPQALQSQSSILSSLVYGMQRIRERNALPVNIPAHGSQERLILIETLDRTLPTQPQEYILNLPAPYPIETLKQIHQSQTEPPTKRQQSIAEIKQQLSDYTARIESYGGDYGFGFWFFKYSRAQNRLANYLLAKELLNKIDAQPLETVFTSFSALKSQRRSLSNISFFYDHGINSSELKDAIHKGLALCKQP